MFLLLLPPPIPLLIALVGLNSSALSHDDPTQRSLSSLVYLVPLLCVWVRVTPPVVVYCPVRHLLSFLLPAPKAKISLLHSLLLLVLVHLLSHHPYDLSP